MERTLRRRPQLIQPIKSHYTEWKDKVTGNLKESDSRGTFADYEWIVTRIGVGTWEGIIFGHQLIAFGLCNMCLFLSTPWHSNRTEADYLQPRIII